MLKSVRCISLELSSLYVTFTFPTTTQTATSQTHDARNKTGTRQPEHLPALSVSLASSLLPEPTVVRLPSHYCVAPSMPHMVTSQSHLLPKLSQNRQVTQAPRFPFLAFARSQSGDGATTWDAHGKGSALIFFRQPTHPCKNTKFSRQPGTSLPTTRLGQTDTNSTACFLMVGEGSLV